MRDYVKNKHFFLALYLINSYLTIHIPLDYNLLNVNQGLKNFKIHKLWNKKGIFIEERDNFYIMKNSLDKAYPFRSNRFGLLKIFIYI